MLFLVLNIYVYIYRRELFMDLGTMPSENQLQTTLDLINQLRLILLVFIGFISIIGTIDKFFAWFISSLIINPL